MLLLLNIIIPCEMLDDLSFLRNSRVDCMPMTYFLIIYLTLVIDEI